MAIKKYAFLAIALLTSAVKADEDSCYKFYVGGDLGMGIFRINHPSFSSSLTDTDGGEIVNDFPDHNQSYSNSAAAFIGGGRIGLAYTGSECWYAAIEGNIHSASSTSSFKIGRYFHYVDGEDIDEYVAYFKTATDRTKYIAGINAHLGYKLTEEAVFYGIIGAKYLNGNLFQNFQFEENNDEAYFTDTIVCNRYNTWGWTAGLGILVNSWCNWDLRLETLYAKFGNRCVSSNVNFDTDHDNRNGLVTYQNNPSLFYGVVSLAYNF